MKIDLARVRGLLKGFDFKNLFREQLGWDNYTSQLDIPVDGATYRLTAIAEKRGFVAYVSNAIPDRAIRLKIDRQVTKSVREHLVVYADQPNEQQVWHWVRRDAGRPLASRDHRYDASKSGDPLIQKLETLAFGLEEEEKLTIVDVAGRVRTALDVDKITKRFYDRFKAEHAAFLKLIKGISSDPDLQWYTSLMLNRLMFVYFIQKKGFLDGDVDYLRNRLKRMQQERGKDKFHTFYRYFLLRLFHDGLGKSPADRDSALDKLLGKVPYLNGGFFEVHPLESAYPETDIPDKAFEKLFDFFDAYQWHLDERPLRADNEINPDVVGYIFEKYINQKQMGAYYTKEDITEYIGKNTIIPFLFDAAEKKCAIAFKPDGAVWRLLRDDPDRYIYDAVRRGVDLALPKDIAAGLKDVSKRGKWNQPAADDYALPTETWREHIARRNRCLEIRERLRKGEVFAINDLITLNLDIRQFAQDVIVNAEGPELLRAFYQAIEGVSVLDPTCGSGAFLFAALDILEPLYEACLDRMQAFMEDLGRSGAKHHPEKFSDFRQVLGQIEQHPSRRYFVLKSIIINNLYGVDIMEEATEICKLRLFLKLVAQIDRVQDIEPLPDVDFNIRAANTLVGFTSIDEVRKSQEGKLGFAAKEVARIEEQAELADKAFQMFRQMQTKHGMDGKKFTQAKIELRRRLDALDSELDRYLAGEYGIEADSPKQKAAFQKWKATHQPFHWVVEYFDIVRARGFDVIIGNPPYVEYSKVKGAYAIRRYQTESCGNLYAFVMERCCSLLSRRGYCGLIVPLSIATTERMRPLQELFLSPRFSAWLSHYDVYPCKLFEGAKQRLTIAILASQFSERLVFTTRYNRWRPEERPILMDTLTYGPAEHDPQLCSVPKVNDAITRSILTKIRRAAPASYRDSDSHVSFYVHRIPYNYIKALNFVPYFWNQVDGQKKSEDYKPYSLIAQKDEDVLLAILNSNLFFWWWYSLFEGYHCGRHEITAFPVGLESMDQRIRRKASDLARLLMADMRKRCTRKECQYKSTGKVVYEEFYPRLSKPLIDQIDAVLAEHFRLLPEELDFIVNYDAKYRTGADIAGDDDE